MHFVNKTYGHDLGLAATFRQWRAESHCRFLHGYSLSFRLMFGATELDPNGWVINFGALKPIKEWLAATFDHRLLIAEDDPQKQRLVDLGSFLSEGYGCAGVSCPPVAQPLVVPAVGCEAFATLTANKVQCFLEDNGYLPRVHLVEIEVREHGANGVIYRG